MASYVRQDIWALETAQAWHPITTAYALAVGVLQSRGAADPTSWTYQANIHGTTTQPPPSDQFLAQCQHGTWHFLPWHRMYIYWFERIVRAAVQTVAIDDATKAAWALPYWNYSSAPPAATLPAPFRDVQMPGGQPNPLFVQDRAALINQGGSLPKKITSLSALNTIPFTEDPTVGASSGFGGPQTSWQHVVQASFGDLENTPHNGVHDQVGGLMSDPDTAAGDPIFWLHHANIDRLWGVWLGDGQGRANPVDAAWTGQQFHFHDETGNPQVLTANGVLDAAGNLGYSYA